MIRNLRGGWYLLSPGGILFFCVLEVSSSRYSVRGVVSMVGLVCCVVWCAVSKQLLETKKTNKCLNREKDIHISISTESVRNETNQHHKRENLHRALLEPGHVNHSRHPIIVRENIYEPLKTAYPHVTPRAGCWRGGCSSAYLLPVPERASARSA